MAINNGDSKLKENKRQWEWKEVEKWKIKKQNNEGVKKRVYEGKTVNK